MKNKDQYTEVKSISWFNEAECLEHIRDYDNHKKEIILWYFN